MRPVSIVAIDPGTEYSAYLVYDASAPKTYPLGCPEFGIVENGALRDKLLGNEMGSVLLSGMLVMEEIENYGMPAGRSLFQTCIWMGRFLQAWNGPYRMMPRREVKQHLCHSVKANDATIRQALLDLFGGKERAVGKKERPGLLYGISKDVWSALALAVTYEYHDDVTPAHPCPTCGWGG